MTDWSEAIEASREFDPPAALPERKKTIPERFRELDALLVSRGWPATSPWWQETIERFYGSSKRQLVVRVGRRGGKSSTLCRVAAVEAIYGAHDIPPGDVGVIPIVSVSRDEATQRLRTMRAIFDEMEIKYKSTAGMIEIDPPSGDGPGSRYPVLVKVFAASIAGVSGFTTIWALCDEVSKWRDADTGANPAGEVLASLRPTMATQPQSKIILSSSPLGRLDAHAAAFDLGEIDFQCVGFAPTWVANPTITEEETHRLEQNEGRWRREYGAQPMDGNEDSLFSASLVDRCTRDVSGDLPAESGVDYVAAMDPGFVKNAWTFAIAGMRYVEGIAPRFKRSVVVWREWRGTQERPLNPEHVLREIQALCRPFGLTFVWSDQYEQFSLHQIGARLDFGVSIVEGGHVAKLARYEELVTQMYDGEIDLPPDKQIRADLLAVRQKLTANGFTIQIPESPDGRHADYAPTIAIALSKAVSEPKVTPEQRRAIRPPEVRPGYGTKEAFDADQAEMTAQLERQNGSEAKEFWETLVVDETAQYFGGF